MKASEFIRVFGLDIARMAVEECTSEYELDAVELKRLVESHELAMDYYGLTRAKEHAESNYTAPEIKDALKQAIADVEACEEVS